jgi:3D (Asp-Asp-Asp) domain-containing protein
MSWYNDTDNSFIDATQTFEGGGGNITEGDGTGTGANSQLSDVLELKLDHFQNEYENSDPTLVYNLYLKNNNIGGEIRFLTADAENNNDVSNNALKYNVKIGTDGKLYLYYTYNPLISALIFSGWTDVIDYIVGNRQATINNAGAIATATTLLQAEITALETSLNSTNAIVGTNVLNIGDHEARLKAVEVRVVLAEVDEEIDDLANYLSNFRGSLSERTADLFDDLVAQAQGSGILNTVQVIRATRGQLAFNLFQAITGGGVIAGFIGLGYYLLDFYKDQMVEEDIKNIVKTLEYAQLDTDKTVVDRIYLGGLQINQTTNTNFTTVGVYEEIDAGNGAKLTIEITSALLAVINSVTDNGTGGFSVGDLISIPKSQIGGSTGNLEINVIAVASVVQLLEEEFIGAQAELEEINNRKRRRRFIPNKDDFSDGLNVTETFTTEPTGESLSQLNISLKLDTAQFNYDASGNLQLTNYSQIAQNQTDIAVNTADIATNSGNISTIQGDISTIQGDITSIQGDISTNTGNITTIQGNISTINSSITQIETDITNLQAGGGGGGDVYKLLLNNDETYSTTTDHIVNIGFNKTEFSGLLFNLIMGAVKTESGNVDVPFSITDFGGFYFGTYPNMERLNYHPTITLVKQDNAKYYNDTNWNDGGVTQLGAFYFKNLQDGFTYDLNKRFEFYANIRFRTLQINANNYILRTATEYEESPNVFNYSPDDNKMSFYYRNFRFYFRHLCKYNLTYYAINTTRNLLTDFLNPTATYTQATPAYGNSAGFKRLQLTTSPFNEDIYLWIKEAFYTVSQSVIDQLINTSTNNDPLFCGMLRNFSSGVHNPFGIVELRYPTFTSGNLYKISRIDIEYKIMRNSGSYVNGIWNSAGWVHDPPETESELYNYYEELVFEIYDEVTDTTPVETILINTRELYSTAYNTITIDLDKSPDLYTYTNKKWILKPRFNSQFSGYPDTGGGGGYNLTPNQRSAFISNIKYYPFIQKTIAREEVKEFTDDIQHSLDTFTYNKMVLHFGLNLNTAPFNDIWYKLNDNLDSNKYTITIPQNFNTSYFDGIDDLPAGITELPIDSINFTEPFFITTGQNGITDTNETLIIGDENTINRLYITHYNWRFLDLADIDITEDQLDKLDYVRDYNYYHETAKVDRYFSCKEFHADIIDFKRLLIDGELTYENMTSDELGTLSQSSDGYARKSLASTNIQNLYGLFTNGYVYYNTITGFTTISDIYDDNDVRNILAQSAGNNLTWNATTNQFDAEAGGGGTNDYNELINTPDLSIYQLASSAFDGNYNSLTNKPDLSIYQLSSSAFSGNYNHLTNKPNLSIYQLASTAFNGNYNNLTNKPDLSIYQLSSSAFDGDYNSLINKPTIFDGNYNNLTNKPTLAPSWFVDKLLEESESQWFEKYEQNIDFYIGSIPDFTPVYNYYLNEELYSESEAAGVNQGSFQYDYGRNKYRWDLPVPANDIFTIRFNYIANPPNLTLYITNPFSDNAEFDNPTTWRARFTMAEYTAYDWSYSFNINSSRFIFFQGQNYFIFLDPRINNVISDRIHENHLSTKVGRTANHYLKNETYTRTEVNDLITLSQTSTDLINYYTKTEIDGFEYLVASDIENFITTANLDLYQLKSDPIDYNNLVNLPTLFSGSYNDLSDTPDLSVYQLSSSAFSGSYLDLSNKPTLFSGSYTDLSDTPDLSVYQLSSSAFSGSYLDLSNKPTLFSGSYNDLTNTPTLFSGSYTDLTSKPDLSIYQLQSSAFSGYYTDLVNIPSLFPADYDALLNKPDLTIYQLASTAFSGSYLDLSNKPTLFSGSYTDLSNKPDLTIYQLASSAFDGDYNNLTNTPTLFSGNYADLTNKPDLSVYQLSSTAFSGSYLDLSNVPSFSVVANTGNYADLVNKPVLFNGDYNNLDNKPNLSIYQLASTAFSGSYLDLSNRPSFATVATTGDYNDLLNLPTLFSGSYNDLTDVPTGGGGGGGDFSGSYNDLTDVPTFATVATSGDYYDLQNLPPWWWFYNEVQNYLTYQGNYDLNTTNRSIFTTNLTCTGEITANGVDLNGSLYLYSGNVVFTEVDRGIYFQDGTILKSATISYDDLTNKPTIPNTYWFDAPYPQTGIVYAGTARPTDLSTHTVFSTTIWNQNDIHTDQIVFQDSTFINTMPLRFSEDGGGYVGIGMEAPRLPVYQLEILGNVKADNIYLGDVELESYGYLRIARKNSNGSVRSMTFHYDTQFNMCWSDYGDTTTVEKTIFKMAYNAPADSLVVDGSGDININNSINFSDGSSINSNKLYLCKVKYNSLSDLATNNTWVYKQNQFNSSFLINEGGFGLGTNGITIPVSGYYEIHIINYFSNITNDRGSIISALAINGAYSNEDYICGSYIRFDSGLRGSRGNAGTIVKYLTQGQQVATAWYETADSSYITIGTNGSSFTLKRIG